MKTLKVLLIFASVLASEACGQTIRVATYNVNWGNRRGDQVLDAISTADPDILCLQETTVQSEGFLRKHLADRYPHFHAVGHEGRYAAERFVFASKVKLGNLTFHPPDAGLFGFYSADFRLGSDVVHIVNVHLTPFQLKRDNGLRDAMAALSTTEDKHASEIEAIVKAIKINQPTVVLGDFNSPSSFNAPKRLLELGLTDSFASVHDDADSRPTWHWPTRPLPIALRIDYVFHTRQFYAIKSDIIPREGSDHYLVVTELKRGEPDDARERD